MSIKRLFDAVERRGDIGRRVAALVLPISNRPRVTSSCAGKIGLREPGEHTSGPNLASRDNVAHSQTTILETPPPATLLHPIRWSMGLLSSQHPVALVGALFNTCPPAPVKLFTHIFDSLPDSNTRYQDLILDRVTRR